MRDGGFAAALATLLGDWRDDAAPRIACGMIGSRQGWVEAPYVDCPAELDALGARADARRRGELAIVPGARCVDAPVFPTSCAAKRRSSSARFAATRRACWPCCPARTANGRSSSAGGSNDFATFMTGELYAVLLAHSILGRMASDAARRRSAGGAAFARGVARGSAGDGLAHAIFGARTLALAGELAPQDVADWLSGVLIGHEIRGARANGRRRAASTHACA